MQVRVRAPQLRFRPPLAANMCSCHAARGSPNSELRESRSPRRISYSDYCGDCGYESARAGTTRTLQKYVAIVGHLRAITSTPMRSDQGARRAAQSRSRRCSWSTRRTAAGTSRTGCTRGAEVTPVRAVRTGREVAKGADVPHPRPRQRRRDDNRIENLRIVCPNCAATFDTHCGSANRRPPRAATCADCGARFQPRERRAALLLARMWPAAAGSTARSTGARSRSP